MASALFSSCVHLLPSLRHEALPSGSVLVPSQQSLPFTGGERAERKERFVRNELASDVLAFPLGRLCTFTDSVTSPRGARGGTDTSEVGVCQAAFYYLKIMHLAPYQGQCCCKALARRRLLTASCAAVVFFLTDLQRKVGLHQKSLLSGTGTDLREFTAAQTLLLLLLLKALSLIGLPSPCGDATFPGRACCFQRHLGEGLPRKTVSQNLRGCSDLLYRTPRQGLPACTFSQFALRFPVPVAAEH